MNNIENSKCSTLLLRTCDATANDAFGSSYTWTGVDLRSILGDLWDKYEYYSLTLVGVIVSTMTSSSLTTHDKANIYYMDGLNWENCNYDNSLKHNTNKSVIYSINYNPLTTSVGIIRFPSTNISNCFSKGGPNVNLTISAYSILSLIPAIPSNSGSGAVYPNRAYLFNIRPIKKYTDSNALLFLPTIKRTSQNTAGTQVLFSSVDLKSALGQLWYKFDYFNLELVNVQTTAISATIDNNSKVNYITLSGLPFQSSSYNSSSLTTTNIAAVGIIDLSTVSSSTPSLPITFYEPVRFSKNFPVVDLQITLISAQTGTICTIDSGVLSLVAYTFRITGIN